ncbi:hypothetical protein GCM10027072_46090 [Streptomyces bullii]
MVFRSDMLFLYWFRERRESGADIPSVTGPSSTRLIAHLGPGPDGCQPRSRRPTGRRAFPRGQQALLLSELGHGPAGGEGLLGDVLASVDPMCSGWAVTRPIQLSTPAPAPPCCGDAVDAPLSEGQKGGAQVGVDSDTKCRMIGSKAWGVLSGLRRHGGGDVVPIISKAT